MKSFILWKPATSLSVFITPMFFNHYFKPDHILKAPSVLGRVEYFFIS